MQSCPTLIDQFQAELQDSRRAGSCDCAIGGCGLAGGVQADRGVDSCEGRVVEDIERFGTKLEARSFSQRKVLDGRDVPLTESRTNQDVPAGVSELALDHLLGRQESFRVEPARQSALTPGK